MKSLIAFLLLSASAIAADCLNCTDGLVGSGPVKYSCPLCEGKGELPDPSVGFQDRASLEAVAATPASRPTAETRKLSVVRISVPEGVGKSSSGSGVILGNEGKVLILTASHVVRDRTGEPKVLFHDGTTSVARVVKEDRAFDLAALECDKYVGEPLVLATPPTAKDTLVLAGFGSLPYTYREVSGKIVARWRPSSNHPDDHFEMTGGARSGDSGGPVFNESNEVAGILWGSRGGRTWVSHSGRVAKFLSGDSQPTVRANVGSACPTGKCQKK